MLSSAHTKSPHSWPKRHRWLLITILLLVLFVAAYFGWQLVDELKVPPGYYRVSRFIDGDTIVVEMAGKPQTVRFIGVDTPETHDPRKKMQCYGQKAADFTRHLVGKSAVRLVADPLSTNRDRYNRLLRYVYTRQNILVNQHLIEQGYGFAYTGFPFTKLASFQQAQAGAQAKQSGLWQHCRPYKNQYGGWSANDDS